MIQVAKFSMKSVYKFPLLKRMKEVLQAKCGNYPGKRDYFLRKVGYTHLGLRMMDKGLSKVIIFNYLTRF